MKRLNTEFSAPVVDNFPLHASALVGRQCDLAKVLGAIEHAKIVTLVGSGGIGKTGLPVEAARQLLPRFPDGVAFVSLAPMSDPRLVLDNSEHLVVAAAAMAEVLAAAGDGMWMLATSREALRVRDEVLCQVPPLEVPSRENQSYEALQTGAVQLFLSRARVVDPQFSSDEHSVCLIGSDVALEVAKRHVVFMQRAGGQSQSSPYFTPYAEAGSPVAQVQQYVLSNLTNNLSVSVLARVANMSVRTFARAFVRDAKVPPAEFVEGARMDAARVMLENTTILLKTIAYKCGFRNAHRMRDAFKRRLGISPQQYRHNFGIARR
jgi:AraC-like DNA-binding protein